MGLLLSILLSYVGAIELVFVIRDVTHQICLHQQRLKNGDSGESSSNDLKRLQDGLRKSIAEVLKTENENAQRMQDGVEYENGYRVVDNKADDVADRWNEQRKKLSTIENDENAPESSTSPESPEINHQSSNGTVSENFIQNERTSNEKNSTIKTQLSQANSNYQLSAPNGGLQPKLSEESSSYEPISQQSSISVDMPEIHFDEYEKRDGRSDDQQNYSEEQLRSLDGIKFRPIVRDDGTGRRRAFKKRQQSSSSTDSGDANLRISREDELKMFTSLEEEEFAAINNIDFKPIQYSSEPTLKVRKHSKRHKRSPPVNELKKSGDGSEEDEIDTDGPWGDVQPKNFHDTELWKRERAASIVEEIEEDSQHSGVPMKSQIKSLQLLASEQRDASPVGKKISNMSSFEDATDSQHEFAVKALKQQASKDKVSIFSIFITILFTN